jgi:hypothetical protein
MKQLLNWIKYSGISITVNLNPLHWRLIPNASYHSSKEWLDGYFRSYRANWLCVQLHLWIDDGSW